MNLRETHHHPWAFHALVASVVLFGACVAWISFRLDGAWTLLGLAALIGEAMVFYGLWIEPKRLTVKRYREALHRNPSAWVRVVFLSDLHAGGSYADDWWERAAIEVQALSPDLIVLGGDYVVDMADPVTDLKPLSKLHAPLGKYFVLGNHDYLDRPQDVRSAIRGFGYEDMTHRSVMLKHEGRDLELHGLDDHWFGVVKAFVRSSPAIPHLLISHEPDALMDVQKGDTDLVLSGHTHGGQVRLPLIGPLFVPTKLGRAVDRGRKFVNGVVGIISNGIGQPKGRPRLFSPPQIVVVDVGV